jgi:AraC family transcriptional regulator
MTEDARRVVTGAIELMGARFRERLTLDRLAADLRVSPAHLCRAFRKATGETVHQHLVRLRVAASVGPVLEGAALTPLAFDLGFASHSHFTAAFRRVHGLPPSSFRVSRGAINILLPTDACDQDRGSRAHRPLTTLSQPGA